MKARVAASPPDATAASSVRMAWARFSGRFVDMDPPLDFAGPRASAGRLVSLGRGLAFGGGRRGALGLLLLRLLLVRCGFGLPGVFLGRLGRGRCDPHANLGLALDGVQHPVLDNHSDEDLASLRVAVLGANLRDVLPGLGCELLESLLD